MENVWILGGLRSFIGVKDGIYRHIPAEVLGAQVLKEIKNRFSLKDEEIDYIIGGNAVAGGGNITGSYFRPSVRFRPGKYYCCSSED